MSEDIADEAQRIVDQTERHVLIVVPPGWKVSFTESRAAGQPLMIDLDRIPRSTGLSWSPLMGLPVRPAKPYQPGTEP